MILLMQLIRTYFYFMNLIGINTMNTSKNALKPRNYLALNPLMQKGGLHESDDVQIARKRARRSCKQNLRKTDWLADLNDDNASDFDESQLELDCL